MSERKELLTEYRELRDRFRTDAAGELKGGKWFLTLIRSMLEDYSRTVDAAYIKRKYPGAGGVNQSKKAIALASRHASVVGGLSAAAVTALEVGIPATGGLEALVAVPAIASSILADLALTSRFQLRAVYDLSVIHGAPLAVDDVEDCFFIFSAALGVKIAEGGGNIAKAVGPRVVQYNVRKLLRAGLRGALVSLLKRIGGAQLAKKLTERAMMRLLVPGISIPISAGANYLFTRALLRRANAHMVRRAAVLQPLIKLHRAAPRMSRDLAIKALIIVMETLGRSEGWDEGQLQALRLAQNLTCLDDDAIRELDCWFERVPADLARPVARLSPEAKEALREFLVVAAALGDPGRDDAYAGSIAAVTRCTPKEVRGIAKQRKMLAT